MQDIWKRIERWSEKQYPSISQSYLPPASEAQIQATADTLMLTLPDDFKAFYQIHNGQDDDAETGILFGLIPMKLERIVEEWQHWGELLEDGSESDPEVYSSAPPKHIKLAHFNAGWIPLCHDWGGNFLGIDMAPDSAGTLGQIINFGADERDKFVVARSFRAFMLNITGQLEDGNFVIDEEGLNFKNPPVRHCIDGLRQQFDAENNSPTGSGKPFWKIW